MMERELARLERELRLAPQDLGLWVELSQLIARTNLVPEFLDREADTAHLCRAWLQRPEEPTILRALMKVIGAVPETCPAPLWWEEHFRLGEAMGVPVDIASGLPLVIRREIDGAEMVLIPEGPFWSGAHRSRVKVRSDPFYLDRYPVQSSQFDAFKRGELAECALARGGEWGEGERESPATGVAWMEAKEYSKAVGGSLPSLVHWERASRWDDLEYDRDRSMELWEVRSYPPDYSSPDYWDPLFVGEIGAERDNPFGVEDIVGGVREWGIEVEDGKARVLGNAVLPEAIDSSHCVERFWEVASRLPYLGFRVSRSLFGVPGSLWEKIE